MQTEYKYQAVNKSFLALGYGGSNAWMLRKERGFRNKFTAGRLLLMSFNSFMCETISYHKMNHYKGREWRTWENNS